MSGRAPRGPRDDALADDAVQNIRDREALIERLEALHRDRSSHEAPRHNRVKRLLYGLHNASLAVVEAIAAWNLGRQADWSRGKCIEAHANASLRLESVRDGVSEGGGLGLEEDAGPCPFNSFYWNGQNYLRKMLSDTDFAGDIPEAVSLLGAGTPFHRNPFLLPLGVDDVEGIVAPRMKNGAWNDVDVQRIRRAAFVILLDEHHRKENMPRKVTPGGDEIIRLRREAVGAARFLPPRLDPECLRAYADMIDPPAPVAIAVCCAHLLLGSVDADITNRLVYLTKAIVLKLFRQPLDGLIRRARAYNPLLRTVEAANVAKIVRPFVMHQRMDSELLADVPDQVAYLVVWMRSVVTRMADYEVSGETSGSADKIFLDLEADRRRGDPVDPRSPLGETIPDDANKENECDCRNASVQTEEVSPRKQKPGSSQPAAKVIFGDPTESANLVPFPVAITVNLREGSDLVSVNGAMEEAGSLRGGDVVRIYDARESSDWSVATSPSVGADGSITFSLVAAYDHSRIVAQETKTRNDALNRLCYPYKRDANGAPVFKPPEAAPSYEDRTRHVASDVNESVHSPLHVREARIWKLVPEEEDARAPWRREYDHGSIPWENENAGRRNCVTHFRVRVSFETIERNCADSPYPLKGCVHQQRVNFFESVPLPDVIDEAFHNVCRWHPKGTLVDNVKWAKLSRKMRFLSNVKNSKHEIDMAFVRHNSERKLDVARFRAIFEDIASIQYPDLSKKEALSRVVWSSIVMLPDVNAMMWKKAKRIAISVEVKRVCAQIRISSIARRNIQRADYLKAKRAAIVIATGMRQFLARAFVSKLLRALRDDEEYQRRWRCATILQTSWRRFFWRNRFVSHRERRIEERRRTVAATRAELRETRDRERALIVFREVIRVDSTIATVTISFRDESYLQDENSMVVKVYVPTTRETFSFVLEEEAIRECLEKALSSEGKLSWDEMLKEEALGELTKRLMLRIVRGRPIFLFSRRNIVEKGLLVDKRVVRAVDEMFVLTTFRSPHDFVFCTYQPSSRLQMKTKLLMPKLREWLGETRRSPVACAKQTEESEEDAVWLLDPNRQTQLIEWLVKRVVIRMNPNGEDLQLLLQYEAEQERVVKLVTKVQSQWRRLKSRRHGKAKTVEQYEKIYVRENKMFAYRNMLTDERQWEKPKLLDDDDLAEPIDEWREEGTVDPATGRRHRYYANYATGQSSWLSEEEAARMVQRRYRSKHESDLVGKKIRLPDIVKAMKFIHGTRAKYEQDPQKLSNMVNFALLVHCLDLDFRGARPVYEKALELSPNHPLIARAYGIFLLASRQTPHATAFQTASRLFHEADVVDPTRAKFESAAEIYFRWAVLISGAKNPLALLNYALLHQCIYGRYEHAERLYRAALSLDPTNTLVAENYRLFIDERYPGGAYESGGPPYSAVRRSRVVEERPEWAEWSRMADPECPKRGMEGFWFNRFSKEARFREPNWHSVWETRMGRSRCVGGKTSNWVEYWDERTETSFFFDVYTKQYTCVHQN